MRTMDFLKQKETQAIRAILADTPSHCALSSSLPSRKELWDAN